MFLVRSGQVLGHMRERRREQRCRVVRVRGVG